MKNIPTSPRVMQIRYGRRMRRLRFFILFLILIASIITALAYFSRDKHFAIENITVSGTHIIDQDEIIREVRKDISGDYIHLFAKSNSLIYPHKQIYKNLIANFPRIESLSISREGLKTLQIKINERVGSYLYCGASVPEDKSQIGENCYFINSDGYIFDKAPYFSGNVYFKYYLELNNKDSSPLAQQMIDADYFHRLSRFIDSVTSLGFKPIYIQISQDGTCALYLNHGASDTSPKIIFKKDNDLSLLSDNLALSMAKKEFSSEINGKYSKLLYIDLRFDNKILYKFQ